MMSAAQVVLVFPVTQSGFGLFERLCQVVQARFKEQVSLLFARPLGVHKHFDEIMLCMLGNKHAVLEHERFSVKRQADRVAACE